MYIFKLPKKQNINGTGYRLTAGCLEPFEVEKLCDIERFKDFDKNTFKMIIAEARKFANKIFNISRARFNLISAYTEVFENDFRLKRLVEQF
jgi:hypothetical protein